MILIKEMDKFVFIYFMEYYCFLRDFVNFSFFLIEKKKKMVLEVVLRRIELLRWCK